MIAPPTITTPTSRADWPGAWRALASLPILAAVPVAPVYGVALFIIAIVLSGVVVEDIRSERIPNGLLLTAAASGAIGVAAAVVAGELAVGDAMTGAVWGLAMSGAVALAAVWLVAPRLIGGGDVKMLALLGAVTGVVDPRAAFVTGATAVLLQMVASISLRRQRLPFAPALYGGLIAGAVSMLWLHQNMRTA